MKKALIVVFSVLCIDQVLKIWVKTHFQLGDQINVLGHWFIIHFTENYGMAFGMEFGGGWGKILLTVFRIIACCGIGWYIYYLSKKKANQWLIVSVAFILAGAFGNIIDSVLYGRLFSDSVFQVASFLPADGGYAPLWHGKVVDMLYFPLIEGHFPQWFPFWKGEEFLFFRPVFNIADSSITIGVALILIFQKKFFKGLKL